MNEYWSACRMINPPAIKAERLSRRIQQGAQLIHRQIIRAVLAGAALTGLGALCAAAPVWHFSALLACFTLAALEGLILANLQALKSPLDGSTRHAVNRLVGGHGFCT
ncbi:hypothetical protein [Pseudomonas paracarnis]|uniref:hypothetical protein n=1 Tax=Pseudomonas paracarnis TaxID=2750625 RepID=UPI00249A6470|nr:hypothetical protein [Pseudomonas paracarnis]MDI3184705.1 hypothetical protein [Pseudomonas paracarnis]